MAFNRYENYHQLTIDELRAKADAAIKQETKKGKELSPVMFTGESKGRNIATNWWGKAWCDNLERYADYASRITRGKKYVKSNAVIDLQISQGNITALVIGSRKKPYQIRITIKPIAKEKQAEIKAKCTRQIENLDALLEGEFPKEMKALFFEEDGLFPAPSEIEFNCSCPDWAGMCKHIAAALYGVGVRLDEDPSLFFTLRGIDVNSFIDKAIADKVEAMLSNACKTSDRVIAEEDVARIFGV